MDTQETSKVKMPAVKKYVLISLLFIAGCASSLPLQQDILGIFYIAYDYSSGESSLSYQFTDNTFERVLSQNLNMGAISKGIYRIAGDTLILDYEPFDKVESSVYRFTTRTPVANQTGKDTLGSVSFHIVNCKDNPMWSAIVVVHDRKGKMIRGYGADSLGNGPKQFITNTVHDFSISYVGTDPVTIPADTLAGYHSEVEVMLTSTTYSQFDGIKKYLIKEVKKNRIVLQPLGNDDRDRIVLVRAGTEG